MEVDAIDGSFVGSGVAFLEDTLELRGRKGEHAAVGMVDDGNFARAKELLGNNDRAEGFLAIESGWILIRDPKGSTYATLPALRMTCASPSSMPRAAAGLTNPS
jgi:hypothetical protein